MIRFFFFSIFLLYAPNALAYLEYNSTFSFKNRNYLFHRDQFPTNDQETFEAIVDFTFDNEKNFKINLEPRLKIDALDSSRNRYIPYESYLMLYTPHFEGTAGLEIIRWGVSNTYNPTDVLNRKDFEDFFYDPESLGEVMATFKGTIDQAGPLSELTFFAIVLPLFQETPLPNNDSRFALSGSQNGIPYSLIQDQDKLNYPEAAGGALKISTTIKNVDFSLHYYHGPQKEPGYVFILDNQGALKIQAFYYLIDMMGTNAEFPIGNFLFHLESALFLTEANNPRAHDINFENNNAIPKNYVQYIPGLDYTFHHLFQKGDLRLSLEYLGEPEQTTTLRDFRLFKNDLFFGIQYDFNNSRLTQFKFGLIQDLGKEEMIVTFDLNSKVYKELKMGLEGFFVKRSKDRNTPLSFFENNSSILARLSCSFGERF